VSSSNLGPLADSMKACSGIMQDMVEKMRQNAQEEIAVLQKENSKDSKPGTHPSSN